MRRFNWGGKHLSERTSLSSCSVIFLNLSHEPIDFVGDFFFSFPIRKKNWRELNSSFALHPFAVSQQRLSGTLQKNLVIFIVLLIVPTQSQTLFDSDLPTNQSIRSATAKQGNIEGDRSCGLIQHCVLSFEVWKKLQHSSFWDNIWNNQWCGNGLNYTGKDAWG